MGSYPSAEVQSVYSTTPANRAIDVASSTVSKVMPALEKEVKTFSPKQILEENAQIVWKDHKNTAPKKYNRV